MPTVSVIIPNYNHAPYLPERIDSVLNQTYQDFEIILMDDCSPDNSRDVIREYAAKDARIRVVLNEKNSGSTYRQWKKGIGLASGPYIWIAESDDYADPTFLARTVQALDAHPNAALVYCQSNIVNMGKGTVYSNVVWTNELSETRWLNDYVSSGNDEIRDYLIYKNVIPNASAILLRREHILGKLDEISRYIYCGDWLLWIKLVLEHEIVYISDPLNYFRMHGGTVRNKSMRNGIRFVEHMQVLEFIIRHVKVDKIVIDRIIRKAIKNWFHSYRSPSFQIPLRRHIAIYRAIARTSRVARFNLHKYLIKTRLQQLRQAPARSRATR